jgi:outer membrane lipoprotein LolB
MWARADSMRRCWFAVCGALLLAACATPRLSHKPLQAFEQEALLRGLSGFGLEGRAAARAGDEGWPSATLSWIQQAGESRLRFSGPLGTGGLTMVFAPGSLLVSNSDGASYRDGEAEEILSSQLGFVPPFEALRYWVLGLPAPGEGPTDRHGDARGRLAEITQRGWRIRYERWTGVATRAGEVQLPQLLVATHEDLRLSLVVNRWKLPDAE